VEQSFPSKSDIRAICQDIPIIFMEPKQSYSVNSPPVFHILTNFMEQSPFFRS